MASWGRLLLSSGLVAVVLTAVGGAFEFRPIAEDLSGRTIARLKAAERTWATVALDGRDLTLGGVAPDPAQRQTALDTADSVFGVRVVEDRTTVLPLAEPYLFSAVLDGAGIGLDGNVPSEAAREALVAALRALRPDVGVADRLVVARGAPDTWAAATTFAFGQLARLGPGRVALAPDGYTIEGTPKDRAVWTALEAELKALPKGVSLRADHLVEPPPVPWRFALATSGNAATITGFLPDAAARADLLAVLSSRFAGGVADRTELAPGAPTGFMDTLRALIAGLDRLTDGGFDLVGTEVTARGGAPTAPIAAEIAAALKAGLPAGFTLTQGGLTVSPPPPQVGAAECEARFASVQASGKILFATGSAELDPNGIRVLDGLVVAALACLDARVTIEGHTDASGDPEANQALSERRAAAVRDHLIAAGIAAERLSSVGFGETRPIADDGTDEGRQANRRIEFRVE